MFKQVHIRTIGRRNYFYIIEKSMFQVDDAFFQSDWVGACRGRWAGTRAVVD